MIRHIVMLALQPGDHGAELADVMQGLGSLQLPGFVGFAHGRNIDIEGKSPDYAYGFICDFTDRAALATYAADSAHQALGQRLVKVCAGGGAGIMVYDLDCTG